MSVLAEIPFSPTPEKSHLRLVEAPVEPEDYQAQAQDLMATIKRPGNEQQNYELAWQAYVEEEENPRLARFSALILNARSYYLYQHELNSLRNGAYNHLQIPEQKTYRDQYRYALCEFNHQIRDFILEQNEAIPRQRLEAWLAVASKGPEQWASQIVAGAVSEVAVFRALSGDENLASLRFGSVEEDLAGIDMLAVTKSGQEVQIDVKSGQHEPVARQTSGGLKLEISVRHELLKGYRLSEKAEEGIRYLTDLAISQSQSHQHYHTRRPVLAATM